MDDGKTEDEDRGLGVGGGLGLSFRGRTVPNAGMMRCAAGRGAVLTDEGNNITLSLPVSLTYRALRRSRLHHRIKKYTERSPPWPWTPCVYVHTVLQGPSAKALALLDVFQRYAKEARRFRTVSPVTRLIGLLNPTY